MQRHTNGDMVWFVQLEGILRGIVVDDRLKKFSGGRLHIDIEFFCPDGSVDRAFVPIEDVHAELNAAAVRWIEVNGDKAWKESYEEHFQ